MKLSFFLLLSAGILLQSVSRTVILVNFALNRDYVSRNLCEKKAVKNNRCKGSCHLKKKLNEQEQQSPAAPNFKDAGDWHPYCEKAPSVTFTGEDQRPVLLILRHGILPEISPRGIFHPPKA